MRHAGIETIDFDKKMAAIKIHFGEPRKFILSASELRKKLLQMW